MAWKLSRKGKLWACEATAVASEHLDLYAALSVLSYIWLWHCVLVRATLPRELSVKWK